MTFSFRALGTTAVVAVTDAGARDDAIAAVTAELAEVDRVCSRFRDDSELTALVGANGAPVRVSQRLLDAIVVALDAARATDGIVDPTIGRTLRLAGYSATYRVVAERDADAFRARFERVPGWRRVEVDTETRTVRLPPGVELDLGATAKAQAADACARIAADAAGCGVLVGLGGDIAVAGGAPAGGWPVGIADDQAAAEVDATIAIATGGLATSSTTVRRWRSGPQVLHHLIDPRSGRPADSCWRTVSVAARTCLDANIASTAGIVLGPEAPGWLRARGLSARLVGADGSFAYTGGWPAEQAAA